MADVRRVEDHDELMAVSGGHPVVELDVGRGFVPPAFAVTVAGATAVVFPRRSDHGVPGAAALGDAAALDALFADPAVRDWFLGSGAQHLSVPREHHHVVARHVDLGERGGDWDWMWTRTAPPLVPREERVVELGPDARAEAEAFLAAESPRTHGEPFARPGQTWVGVRDDDGRLVALGGSEPSTAGTPVLAGIAVATSERRRGWGAAVTAALTRRAVERTGACALGMFADNDAARRVYHRLGYTTAVEWRSRWRDPAAPPAKAR